MSEAKHTPGPWKVIISSWENSLICAEDGTLIAICKINADVTEDTQDEFESIKNYNADILADAWQLPDLRRENAELQETKKENILLRQLLNGVIAMGISDRPNVYGKNLVDQILENSHTLSQYSNKTKTIMLHRAGDRICHLLNIISNTYPLGSGNKPYIAKLTQEWEKAKEESE